MHILLTVGSENTYTLSMRLRGSRWFLLRVPMRAIVPDLMVLGQEVL